jgi:hypothetical protein
MGIGLACNANSLPEPEEDLGTPTPSQPASPIDLNIKGSTQDTLTSPASDLGTQDDDAHPSSPPPFTAEPTPPHALSRHALPAACTFTVRTLKPPCIPFSMPAQEQAQLWQEYAKQMTAIASQKTQLQETAIAQWDIVTCKLQDVQTREEAECQVKKRPKKVTRKYNGSFLTNNTNTAI